MNGLDDLPGGRMRATGTIAGLRDCGTIVLVFLDAEEGRVVPVPMDHRAFRHLLEGEACGPAELVGRSVSFDGELVKFLD
jgi:hypothetical protein